MPTLQVVTRSRVLVADYRPGSSYGPRLLTDFELVWLLEGSAVWRSQQLDAAGAVLAEDSQLLRPGMIALARAGTRDSYQWDRDRSSRHAYVHFQVLELGALPPAADWPTVRQLSGIPILQGLSSYLLELAGSESEAARRRSDEMVQLLLDIFVTGPLGPGFPQLPGHVAEVVEYVRRVWSTSGMRIVTADEIAEAANVSVGHLFRLFRDSYGCGPVRALELVRLARAAVSLQRSNATIAEIAERSGYSNPYHFSRRFAQVYATPPGAFRKGSSGADPLAPLKESRLLPMAHLLLNTAVAG
ncbi:hypothetical protein GCM10009841_27770 [Microlunatus panaciterrae]|nr:AraC family transcriptional regulator [Microlunatus panaciterrae]